MRRNLEAAARELIHTAAEIQTDAAYWHRRTMNAPPDAKEGGCLPQGTRPPLPSKGEPMIGDLHVWSGGGGFQVAFRPFPARSRPPLDPL